MTHDHSQDPTGDAGDHDLELEELEHQGPTGAPAQTPEAEAALELCSCGTELDGDLFHDVDELERPYCAACCPTCTRERDELDARRARLDDEELRARDELIARARADALGAVIARDARLLARDLSRLVEADLGGRTTAELARIGDRLQDCIAAGAAALAALDALALIDDLDSEAIDRLERVEAHELDRQEREELGR